MITPLQSETVTDVTELIADSIPDHESDRVRQALVKRIVDDMPSDIMLALTNSPDDFDFAEMFLDAHYKETGMTQLIVDSFNLIGSEQTADLLDSLDIQETHGISEGNPS
jgi:hypothetical protein